MLKMRIVTATVLICLVVMVILYANILVKALVISGVSVLAGYEWLKLTRASVTMQVVFYVVLLACFCGFYLSSAFIQIIFCVSFPGWLLALLAIVLYQRGYSFSSQNTWTNIVLGIWLIAPMWAGLYVLLAFDPLLALYLLIVVWSADVCAYFSGRQWGRHLLLSRVSPGKTWEGAIGAVIGTAVFAFITLKVFFPGTTLFWPLFFLSLAIVPISILGDLFESMIKRIYGVKDSGQLVPGHGGVLDRLDSLTVAAPVFAWAYFFFFAHEI